ncbi:peroxiredoxin family protein [Sphingobacterium suaedae]|uniref:Peroxiredoxin family protein n=1 Tax=Sphingobacterium suaedae TaxID=1686402 RepID=A0ABW5KI44_9SPHI
MTKNRLILSFILFSFHSFGQHAPKELPKFMSIHDVYCPERLLQQALPKEGRIVLVFYDTGCGHCQELGTSIAKNLPRLTDVSFFFISMNDREYVDGFINMFAKELKNKPRISFWKDPGVEFLERFRPENYPATYVYDAKSKKLLRESQVGHNVYNTL